MAGRYAVHLPVDLKKEAEELADEQGISLNQFILWSVAEKVSSLKSKLDDTRFPGVTYRRGASGSPLPVLRGSGLPVHLIVAALLNNANSAEATAKQYGISVSQVKEISNFYSAHREEIDRLIEIIKQDTHNT